jgi:hypothetical protein
MLSILKLCFAGRPSINLQEFIKITEEVSSDMALSVMSLLREKLPCSENYWRYRRNFELHLEKQSESDPNVSLGSKKVIA